MGVNRDLKKATESYWGGKLSQKELLEEGKRLRNAHWRIQKSAGIDIIPSNDFSYYDHVLDHIQLFGVSSAILSSHEIDIDQHSRSYPRNTPSTSSTQLMNSSQWAEASRNLIRPMLPQSMFLLWYVLG